MDAVSTEKKLIKRAVKKRKLSAVKISNNFVEATMYKNELGNLKTLFFLAQKINDELGYKVEDWLDEKCPETRILSREVDIDDYCTQTGLSRDFLHKSRQAMATTAIKINLSKYESACYSLIPYSNLNYQTNTLKLHIYENVAKLLVKVKRAYTYIPTEVILAATSRHTLRLLPLVYQIAGFDLHTERTKVYTLDELNKIVGTNYTNYKNFEEKVLKPAQQDMAKIGQYGLDYSTVWEHRRLIGRPRIVGIRINPIDKKEVESIEMHELKKHLKELKQSVNDRGRPRDILKIEKLSPKKWNLPYVITVRDIETREKFRIHFKDSNEIMQWIQHQYNLIGYYNQLRQLGTETPVDDEPTLF